MFASASKQKHGKVRPPVSEGILEHLSQEVKVEKAKKGLQY
jgi:hypothetical protein